MSSGPLGSSKPTQATVVGGVFNSGAPVPNDGQSAALQLHSAGNLLVNVAVGGGGGGANASVGATGATAPTSATEIGTIDGTGKLQGASATNPVPISAASLPLPTGAALDATLTGGTQKTKLVDSTGTNLATVKAASTAAVAADPALVVAVSPNNSVAVTQPTGTNLHVVVDSAPTT